MPSNNINIKSVAVIGAGVMGAQLAALFANKGIRSYLYDITTDTATLGKDRLKIIKPPPLEQPENIELIQACSLDKDIHKIKKVDWIIEAVTEKIEIKTEVFKKKLQKNVIYLSIDPSTMTPKNDFATATP